MNTFLRIAPMLIWAILVLAGVTVLAVFRESGTRKPVAVVAAVNLPRNTLLSGPTQQPRFTGKYIVARDGVKAGATIRPEDVADAPIPPGGTSTRLFLVVPISDVSTAATMPVGLQSQLCGTSPPVPLSVSIQYVQCNADRSACSVTVDVPIDLLTGPAGSALKEGAAAGSLYVATYCRPANKD